MNNITLTSMLREFSNKNSLSGSESLSFEKFTTHSILANDYHDSFEIESVGTGDCVGVDAVAIAVSDILVYSTEAAKSLTAGQFESSFSFIQAKTSSSLDLGDYLKFLQTVFVFFTESLESQPDELKNAFLIKEHVYSKAAKFRSSPELRLHYVYTGDGEVNSLLSTQINSLIEQIRSLPYRFSKVTSKVIGATELASLYKESLNRTTKSLMFQRHVALPKLESATAAYLGVSSCLDYIELLKNQDGNINKGLFYDNVRDFLGSENSVNKDIEGTIKSPSQRNLFSVLNNGVTLVARKVVPSGDRFEISGFQVVNGCQTSHVLFNNRDHVTQDMYLTVKLIETDDVDLSSSVIKATNSQSIVLREAFATIKPYHRQLEDFFRAMNKYGHRFFYERRPHQYDDDDTVNRSEVVSAPLLIKSFVSVALEQPHKVHFYYGQILRDYNSESTTLVFDEAHHPGLYFVSHVIVAKCKDIAIKNKVGRLSYHLALLVKTALGISLNAKDKLSDGAILKLLERINAEFDAAASEALVALSEVKFGINDHMIPEKTAALLEVFEKRKQQFYKAKKAGAATGKGRTGAASAVSALKLDDGNYRVKDLKFPSDGVVVFQYGPNKYTLPHTLKVVDGIPAASAQVGILKGAVVMVNV
ncbi:AIPR family protein [Chromobacterium haemolyticum]|uniref:AIPR family protein n=2 Tax=Chromobacterium haemolyticum TaxID=394935 RepID=UPI0013169DC2|nr:AIPR family protein [Chromobacterium haemolyticum]BBH13610.1 hypothetical protein CH06BL_28580 [Chromobacterium haemolyticum]